MTGRSIALSRGRFVWVDEQDFAIVSKHSWHCYTNNRVNYARSGKIRMHRLILRPPDGMVIDHIDGDGLNNRRSNLRICTPAENSANRSIASKHGFKGVSFKAQRKRNPWQAALKFRGQRVSLGSYPTKEDAARAYDKGALAAWGDFARLNFPDEALRDQKEAG